MLVALTGGLVQRARLVEGDDGLAAYEFQIGAAALKRTPLPRRLNVAAQRWSAC